MSEESGESMKTYENMPCIVLSRDFDIISIDKDISLKYPRLCDNDYIHTVFSRYNADDFTSFRLLNSVLIGDYDIKLAAVADGDVIKCFVLNNDIFPGNQMLNVISYQMREPISSIFALLPIITDNVNRSDSDKAIAYLDGIYSKSYKLLRNVTNISTATKIMEGNSFRWDRINLSQLVDSLITSVLTVEKNVKIESETEENIIINGNLSLLTNGILNLFANSFDYRQDRNVEIKIKLTLKGNKAVLTYSDNSKGIKEQFLPLVFNPYFSKDPYADGEDDPSLGLGLFIAKSAFTHAGGSILLTSKFGDGVKYSVSFPVCRYEETVLESNATDFLLNRYSEVFVQLCDSCSLPSLK